MISALFRRKPKLDAPVRPAVPDGITVWAVGDIHGRLDLLRPIVEAILEAARSDPNKTVVIFLGDYIDRGAESRGVLRYLAHLEDPAVEFRFLKGNHEEAMLKFLAEPEFGPEWCEYGGIETLQSYGLRIPHSRHRKEAWSTLSGDLAYKVSAPELDFLRALELSLTVGDYFFAHAGARPGQALRNQSARDLLWIRRSFLDDPEPFEKIVVHGHTPVPAVHADHRRIGIDTKAYESGVLTAIRLEGDRREILQAKLPPGPDGQLVLSRSA